MALHKHGSRRDQQPGDPQSHGTEWRYSLHAGNLDGAALSLFVGGESGDLHMAPGVAEAIDQLTAPAEVVLDLDGDTRPVGVATDIGADECRDSMMLAIFLPLMLRVPRAPTSQRNDQEDE